MIHDFIQSTMIQIQDATKARLKRLARTDEDSCEMVISRLLKGYEDAKRIEVNARGYAFLGRGNKGKKAIVIGMED